MCGRRAKQIEDVKSELLAANEALKAEMQAELLKVQNNLNTLIVALQTQLDELSTTVANNKAEFEKAIADNKAELEKAIADNKAELEKKIEDEIANLEKRVAANETAITDIKSNLSDLEKRVSAVETLLNKTVKDVVEAHTLAKNDSIRIDALEAAYENLKEQHKNDNDKLVAKVDSICNELNTIKESVKEAIELANENLELAKEYTDERIEEVMDEIETINTTLAELEAAYKAADAKLQNQIDAMQDILNSVMKRVKENAIQIKKLIDQYNKVDESLKQFITGIILQRTENPVFGSFSFPANIQTNVLMAYYGNAGEYGIEFPSFYPRYYVRESETLTEKDIEMLGVAPYTAKDGETLVSGAGKVYVTVNPSNVNFEGQTLPIVNSIEEESGIKLSPLKYSDKKLTFGATRAAANGFYEAEATLAAEDIEKVKMTFDFNVKEIKETVKDVINPTDGVNVTQVVNTVANIVSEFNQNLDANALKASWTDSLGVSRSIYSQYNLATTAISPLSYDFYKDNKYTSFPGFDQIHNFVGKMMDKVGNKIHLVFPDKILDIHTDSIENLKIDTIDINTEQIEVTVVIDKNFSVPVPGGNVLDKDGNIIGSFSATDTQVEIKITVNANVDSIKDMLNDLEVEINDQLTDYQETINEMINTINSYLGEFNGINQKFADIESDIDSVIGDIKDKVIEYLDKVENKLLTAVNSINKALQPILLVKTTDGFQKVSQTIYNPTWMSAGDVQFVATSYTAEVIAPSYKKLVGVTNVYSMDRSQNAQTDGGEYLTVLREANAKAGVAEILDGDTQIVNFSAKKNYIYEVTYTSVDFSGKVVAKKFYVTVK